MPTPIFTNKPIRYRDDQKTQIPDSLKHEDGSLTPNPEWEASQYEQVFIMHPRHPKKLAKGKKR